MKRLVATSALTLLLAAGGWSRGDTSQSSTQQSQRFRSTQQQQQQQQQQRMQQQRQTQQQRQHQQTITGEITGFRHISSRTGSSQEKRSLVRLQLQNGRAFTVDLGPKRNLDRLDLQTGDEIRLNGRFANRGGQQVFLASRVYSDGRTVNIQQPRQTSGTTRAGMNTGVRNASSPRTLTGTVQGFRHLNLRGSQGQKQTHTLANIRLDNGRTTFVDLGPKSRVDNLSLQRGERVRIQASEGTLDGKRILLANRLSRGGQQTGQRDGEDFQAARKRVRLATGDQITLQGTVQGYQIMSFGSGGQNQVLLRLDLQDGRSVLVDAGRYQPGELDLKNLNLQDRAVITARREGSRIVADDIRFEPAQGTASQTQEGGQTQWQWESDSESNEQDAAAEASNANE